MHNHPRYLFTNINPLVLDYHVHNLVGNNDYLLGLLAVEPTCSTLMSEGYALNLVASSAGRNLNVVARLAIEEHGVLNHTFFEIFLVPGRPLRIADGAFLTKHMPEFLGDVRCEWREQYHKVALHALGAALHATELVGANHERSHTGVVRELLNVLRHFLDELVD